MDFLKSQALQAVVRNLAQAAAGALATRGLLQGDEQDLFVAAVVAVVVLVTSIVSARFKSKAIALAGGRDAVKEADTPPKSLVQ